MSVTEKQQMNLDTESAAHVRMEAQSRGTHRYVLLQVWCGLLTVSMVVMAAILSSIKPKYTQGEVSSQQSDYFSTTADTPLTPLTTTAAGSSRSCIQLVKYSKDHPWQVEHKCKHCSIVLRDDSIYFSESGLYFLYAQVTFSRHSEKKLRKSVILKKNPSHRVSERKLVEGLFPNVTESTVWVARIVSLAETDSISFNISDDFLTESTFWGAIRLD